MRRGRILRNAAWATAAAAVGACLLACGGTAEDRAADRESLREMKARVFAEKVVKRMLLHPYDAEFHWDDQCKPAPDGTYIVAGKVTAPNGLGNRITEVYIVRVAFDAAGEPRAVEAAVGDSYARFEQPQEKSPEPEPEPEPAAVESVAAAPPEERELPSLPPPELRTWTSADGDFTVVAELVEFSGGEAVLRTADGREIRVTPGKLCPADQTWIREELRRRRGHRGGA